MPSFAGIHARERRPLAATPLHHKHAINNATEFQTTAQIPNALLTPRKWASGHLHSCREPLNSLQVGVAA